jgi:hypothetical protein
MNHLPSHVFEECRASAIPDRLVLANFGWIEGDEAIALLTEKAIAELPGHAQQYATGAVRNLRKRYEHAAHGGWYAIAAGDSPYFKPQNPRKDYSKGKGFGEDAKLIKYETGAKCEASPIRPTPVVETLQTICDRYQLNLDEALEAIWRKDLAIQRDLTQLTLTESCAIGPNTSTDQPSSSFSKSDTTNNCEKPSQNFGNTTLSQDSIYSQKTAQESHNCESIAAFPQWQTWKTSNETKLPNEAFWKWWADTGLPILITEGIKKALAAMAHGIPAIAVRGITQWNIKGTNDLKPELAQFATEGRTVYVAFDQDKKVRTQIAVYRQVCKLSKAIESHDAIARVVTWDGSEGKGIDDALYAAKDGAQQWLGDRLKASLSLKDYRATAARQAAIMRLNASKVSRYPLTRYTEGDRYFPALPALPRDGITVIDGNTGSGKTDELARIVAMYRALGILVLVLCPLNSLGKQTAKRMGLPHIHDYGTSKEDRELLWAEVQVYGGLVCCPDSLPRIAGWFTDRPVALIVDEANQVTDHTTSAQTIGDNLPAVATDLKIIAQNAIARFLSEDGVPDRTIAFWSSISGCDRVERYCHRRDSATYRITAFETPDDYRASLFDRFEDAGDRPLLFVTATKEEGKILEQIISEYFPELKVIRVDGDTNEQGRFDDLYDEPGQWLKDEQPNVLILSPSVRSGVSIEGGVSAQDAYFADVWGYFTCHGTDIHLQLLGRYRPPVPRYIFVPPFILGNYEESLGFKSREVAKNLRDYTEGLATALEIEALDDSDRDLELETAILNYRADTAVEVGAQKSIARESLKARLTDVGHTWHTAKHPSKPARQAARKLWAEAREKVWQSESEYGASLDIEDSQHYTVKWAIDTLSSTTASHESRLKARKVLLRDSYPGIDFNSAEDWYFVLENGGKNERAVKLQTYAEHPDYARSLDSKDASKILGAPIRAFHRMPRRYAKGALIRYLGLPEFADWATENPYDNASDRAKAIKAKALQYAADIYRMLRIKVEAHQTPVEIVNKLLRKIGRKAEQVGQHHKRATDNRDKIYAVNPLSAIHEKFLKASRRKDSSTGHSICIKDSPPNNKSSDHTKYPQSASLLSPESLADIRSQIAEASIEVVQEWIPKYAIDAAMGAIAS